jgi:hypothetical protein
MSFWTQENGKLYLPPSRPTAKILSTDEYVKETNIYFHVGTDRLLNVGHPYFEVRNDPNQKLQVPKVSGNAYRVLRMTLPDPNRFALIDQSIFDPNKERLVWRLKAVEIDRGGPLGIGTSGHPLFNKYSDTENPVEYPPNIQDNDDLRMDVSHDPKQSQMFIIGCAPSVGEHWDKADFCKDHVPTKGDCYPIKLVTSYIEDGDMGEIGYGNLNFKTLQEDRSNAPLDIVDNICKYPDFVKMGKDAYGDSMFFFGKLEQLYARHFYAKAGTMGDSIPQNDTSFIVSPQGDKPQHNLGSHIYFPQISGSLTSTNNQLFNRPYFLQRAQGKNNGVLWNNQVFITILDNSRNTNFIISVYKGDQTLDTNYTYKVKDFKYYTRHVEEIEIEMIMQLCKVSLEANILAHINVMNPRILDEWKLAFVPPAPQGIEDKYRFIESLATECPSDAQTEENTDPYKDLHFWNVDLTENFSSDLDQFPLGRKFLYQSGVMNGIKRPRNIAFTEPSATRKKSIKRRRKV